MAAVKRYTPEARPRMQWRGLLLYILPLPLLPSALYALADSRVSVALARAGAFALAMLAATLIRKGIRLEAEGQRRRFKRRASTVPYRLIGAGVLSVALFMLAWLGIEGEYGIIESLLFAALGLLGCYLYYEFDVLQSQPEIATIGITTEELIELLDEAEERIASIEQSSKEIRNIEFRDRLRRIVRGARGILDTIEEDPTDARRARKFLKVYLDGAQQVTHGYVKAHRFDSTDSNSDTAVPNALDDNFRRVLTTIDSVIEEQQAKLRQNNVDDLDVNIEVLQMQLEKEGVV